MYEKYFIDNNMTIVRNVFFQQEDGKWMYSGGEDCSARIWDLKMRNLSCQRAFQTNAPVNAACLHPNQQVVFLLISLLYSYQQFEVK